MKCVTAFSSISVKGIIHKLLIHFLLLQHQPQILFGTTFCLPIDLFGFVSFFFFLGLQDLITWSKVKVRHMGKKHGAPYAMDVPM